MNGVIRRRLRRASTTVGGTVGIAALLSAAAPPEDRGAVEPAAQVAEGQAIFRGKGNCFSCHGPEGKGTVLAPDLTDDEWLNFPERPAPEAVRQLVTTGVPKPKKHPAPMLPMGGARLSDLEVDQVVAYVLSLSTPP